jgi:hypothetical protein
MTTQRAVFQSGKQRNYSPYMPQPASGLVWELAILIGHILLDKEEIYKPSLSEHCGKISPRSYECQRDSATLVLLLPGSRRVKVTALNPFILQLPGSRLVPVYSGSPNSLGNRIQSTRKPRAHWPKFAISEGPAHDAERFTT